MMICVCNRIRNVCIAIPFSAFYTSCFYLTDVIIRAQCEFVAKAEHELNEWMPNDGGVFINAKDNGNATISLIQCKRTNNWTLGVLAVKCHDRNKIVSVGCSLGWPAGWICPAVLYNESAGVLRPMAFAPASDTHVSEPACAWEGTAPLVP